MEKAKREYNNTMYNALPFLVSYSLKRLLGLIIAHTVVVVVGWLVPFYGARKCTFSCRSYIYRYGVQHILSYIEYRQSTIRRRLILLKFSFSAKDFFLRTLRYHSLTDSHKESNEGNSVFIILLV